MGTWRVLPKSGKRRCPKCNAMVSVFYEVWKHITREQCNKCDYVQVIPKQVK